MTGLNLNSGVASRAKDIAGGATSAVGGAALSSAGMIIGLGVVGTGIAAKTASNFRQDIIKNMTNALTGQLCAFCGIDPRTIESGITKKKRPLPVGPSPEQAMAHRSSEGMEM